MTEKIKINVTAHTAAIIEKDAESFEFFKKDGHTLNRNALLTNLIVNYHEMYRQRQRELFDYLENAISQETGHEDVSELCYRIAGHINKHEAAPNHERFNCTLSVKPTKQSEPVIEYIEAFLLSGSTLSEYFRNMFSSYAALPQDEREKIIFRPQYLALTEAIRNQRRVFITTSRGKKSNYQIAPYAVSVTKEELHCYLLAGQSNACFPIRLSRILSVAPLQEEATFSEEQLSLFAKMIKYGPQFSYAVNDGEVKVRLTEHGKNLFAAMYVHRPIPDRIEGNDYYFNCSHVQLIQYFVRFGKDAYIVYPQKLQGQLLRFHSEARKQYLNN